jgi:hypothetical protein
MQMAKAPANIRSLARAHTDTAIRVLAGIMSESRAPAAARVQAATALLDRGWGKPAGSEVNLVLNDNRQVHVHLEPETLALLEEARALLAKPVEALEKSH